MLSCLIISVFVIKNYNKRKTKDWLELGYIFIVVYLLYTTIGAWGHILINNMVIEVILQYYIAVIIGLIFFCLGYMTIYIDNSTLIISNKVLYKKKHITSITKIEFIITFLFILFAIINFDQFVKMVTDFGSGSSYIEYSARSARTASSGPLSQVKSYFYTSILLFTFYYVYTTNKIKIIYMIPTVIIGMYGLTSGGRTILLYIAVLLAIYINYCKKMVSLKAYILFIIVGMFGMILIGHLRAVNTIENMVNLLFSSDNIRGFFKLSSSGEFYNTSDTLFTYIYAINHEVTDFNYGYSYIVEMLNYIPYFLFPNRPLPLPEQFMLNFFPSAPSGTGHGWFILNDGYMSLGVVGVAIEMFTYGMIIARLYKWYVQNHQFALPKFIYGILIVYVFLSVRSSMLSGIKTFFLDILPYFLIYKFELKSYQKSQHRSRSYKNCNENINIRETKGEKYGC